MKNNMLVLAFAILCEIAGKIMINHYCGHITLLEFGGYLLCSVGAAVVICLAAVMIVTRREEKYERKN